MKGKVITVFLLGIIAMHAATSLAAHAEYQVIVHPENPATSIERKLLADIFLKKASKWPGGEKVAPVDLPASSPVREKFSADVLKRSSAAIKSYWQQLIFS